MNKIPSLKTFVTTLTLVLTSWLPLTGAAGESFTPDRYPVFTIPRLGQRPAIDGAVRASEWAGALRLPPLIDDITGFTAADPTDVYIAHCEERIYFAWRAHRSYTGPMITTVTEPGYVPGRTVWKNDVVELFLDTGREDGALIVFAGNAAGAFGDGTRTRGDTNFDPTWPWDYATRVTETGWEGELSIAFADLGLEGPPDAGSSWGIDFWRNNKTPEAKVDSLARSNRRPERFARMAFGTGVPALRLLQAGSIGDAGAGILAEINNASGTEQHVHLTGEIRRRREDLGSIDLIAEYHEALTVRPGEVETFATPERALAELLGGFDILEAGSRAVAVPPGQRRTLQLSVPDAAAGDYVLIYRFVNEAGQVLLSGLTPAQRRDPVHLTVIPYYLPWIEQLEVSVSFHTAALRERVASVQLRAVQGGEVLAVSESNELENGAASLGIDVSEIRPGSYRLEVSALDGEGRVQARASVDRHRPEPPDWLTSPAGTSAFVPAPFTPVEVDGTTVRVWGREYPFDDRSFLPAAIYSQGENLLSAPPRVHLCLDGDEHPLKGSIAFVEADPEFALLRWTGTAGNLPVLVDIRVEFDGFMTFDVELDGSDIPIDRFWVELPIGSEHATDYKLGYFFNSGRGTDDTPYSHGLPGGGLTKEGFSIGFNHQVWLGSEHRGLEWVAETAEHWRFADRGRALDVEPDAQGTTTLRLRVIDRPSRMDAPRYRWGLAVGPVRPYAGASDGFYVVQRNYDDGAVGNWPAVARRLGANWMIVHQQWNRDFSFGEPFREIPGIEDRAELVRGLRESGAEVVFYTGWNGLTPRMADWPNFGEAMRRVPTRFSYGGFKPCTRGGFVEYLSAGAAWMREHIGVSGLFLDDTAVPQPCANPFHGCGFVDPDTGERIVTRDIWGRRELFKRLFKFFNGESSEQGLIYSHVSVSPLAVESFVTVRHTGESEGLDFYTNPDVYRSINSPFPRGIPLEHAWRSHHPVPRNLAWAMALLHDNRIKMYTSFAERPHRHRNDYSREGIDWRMWTTLQWFDWDLPHRWHSYTVNGDVLGVDGPDGIHASFRINDGGQIYLNAANLGEEPASAVFQFNLDALGLPGNLYARDAVTLETFEIHDGRFSLDFLGWSPRVLKIHTAPVPHTGPGSEERP